MASKAKANVSNENTQRVPLSKPKVQNNPVAAMAQHAQADPQSLTSAEVITMSRLAGNQAVARLISQRTVQTKLTVGAAHDAYEQEADQVAEQVMSLPSAAPVQRVEEEEEEAVQTKPLAAFITPTVQRHAEEEELQGKSLVQRAAVEEEEELLQGKSMLQRTAPEEEEEVLQGKSLVQRAAPEEEEEIQAKRLSEEGFEAGADIEQRLDRQRGGGTPLPAETRDFMEPRFGADFSAVRLHSGSDAAQLNRAVNAQAFTTGKDIFLGESAGDIQSSAGKSLLAHELTHVIQQNGPVPRSNVQRHPEGANLLPDAPAAAEDLKQAQQGEAQTTSKTPAIRETGEEDGAEAEASGPVPTPTLDGTMSIVFSQKAIQDAFGEVAPNAIITGQITVVSGEAALYQVYDQLCIDGGILNKDTGEVWKLGDKKKANDKNGTRTNAFAYGDKVWVDITGQDPTATVHEMLHVNTSAGFLTKTGRIINEGITQRLAVKAILATGSSVQGSERTYQDEQYVVKMICDLVGEDVVTKAYFNGADQLINAYDALKGTDAWKTLKSAIDLENYQSIISLIGNKEFPAQVALDKITSLLSGWVSDKDLTKIKAIYDTSSDEEKKYIRKAVEPMTHETFWRDKTRTKVREIIEA